MVVGADAAQVEAALAFDERGFKYFMMTTNMLESFNNVFMGV